MAMTACHHAEAGAIATESMKAASNVRIAAEASQEAKPGLRSS
jgi:hypothetical protein